jgi:hypothetical protein
VKFHAKKMIKAKFQSNFARVIRESEKINEYFYPRWNMPVLLSNGIKGMALFYSGQDSGSTGLVPESNSENSVSLDEHSMIWQLLTSKQVCRTVQFHCIRERWPSAQTCMTPGSI